MTLEELLEKENLRNTPLDVFISLRENIDDIEILSEVCSHINFENDNTFFQSLKDFLVSYGKKLSMVDGRSMLRDINNSKSNKNTYQKASESIIRTINRPAFLIRNDKIDSSIDIIWKKRLDESEANINSAIPSVGRIEIGNHPHYNWVGTGWLIKGTNIVVTNRHVAYNFASRQDDSFDINSNHKGKTLRVSIDFKEEYNVDNENTFRVSRVLHIAENDEPDVALMEILSTSYEGNPLPKGLEIAKHESDPKDAVFTIGYPANCSMLNQKNLDPIFNGIYDVKRLAPGIIYPSSAAPFIYMHDCTTWYGNSGSPVIELTTGKVVGIHYAGSNEEYGGILTNWAVRSTYLLELLQELQIRENHKIP
ncbi:MAG: hypothetical protein Aureis2KO_03950 [Aureisphaera sp.]